MYATAHNLRYREQDCPLTLAEGLAEYYAANEGVIARAADLPPDSAALFRSHDMCHVIFGLDTTLEDEAMADTRTMMSCDVGAARYAVYLGLDPQAQKILKDVGIVGFVWGHDEGVAAHVPRHDRCMANEKEMAMETAGIVSVPPARRIARGIRNPSDLILAELCFHQRQNRFHRFVGVRPFGSNLDCAMGPGRQHHQPHDGTRVHALAVLGHGDLRFEACRGFHDLGGCARMKSALVGDGGDRVTALPRLAHITPRADPPSPRAYICGPI